MLFKRVLITKLLFQIGIMVPATLSEKSDLGYVSENWHKTQFFIFYNCDNLNEGEVDCLGTILSPRFVLTTATCITFSDGTDDSELQNVALKRVLDYPHLGTYILDTSRQTYIVEKFIIHPDFQRGKKIWSVKHPDLAILKLTRDIANSEDEYVMNQKIEEFYPLENPGEYAIRI